MVLSTGLLIKSGEPFQDVNDTKIAIDGYLPGVDF